MHTHCDTGPAASVDHESGLAGPAQQPMSGRQKLRLLRTLQQDSHHHRPALAGGSSCTAWPGVQEPG